MNERLIGILWDSGIILITGALLTYLGYWSASFGRSSEGIAPDRWVGTFRVIARIVGPILCIAAVIMVTVDLCRIHEDPVLAWRQITSQDGRFRISSPAALVKEVKDVAYGERRVTESRFDGVVAPMGFHVSYIDLPASIVKRKPDDVLNKELEAHIQATGVNLLSKESIRFAGFPAVRFKLHDVQKGIFVEGILLLAKERRYQLAVRFTSESSAQNREPFFNSFQVLDGP
jgi:hypothetical protein